MKTCDGTSAWRACWTRVGQKDPDRLPLLYDPVLLAMSPQAFTLSGFERIEGVDYAQSWLVMRA